MTPLARVAIVGGISTGFVLPSIGRFAKAVTSTPTLPSAALGAIPGSVILLTHQLSSKIFNSQSWIAKKEITVYLIYVLDLAAGLTTTIIIATLTRTELQHAIAISTLSCCAILITLGIESFFKSEDLIKENVKNLDKLGQKIGVLENKAPPPPPDTPRGQVKAQLDALNANLKSLTEQLRIETQNAKQNSEWVKSTIPKLGIYEEEIRRLNERDFTREELDEKIKVSNKFFETTQKELQLTRESYLQTHGQAQLLRVRVEKVEASLARRTDSDVSDEKQPPKTNSTELPRPIPSSFLEPITTPITNVWSLLRGKQPNASTTVNVDGESLKKGQV